MAEAAALAAAAVFAPIVAAAGVPLAARYGRRARDAYAVAASTAGAVLAVALLFWLSSQAVVASAWVPTLGLSFTVRLDALSGTVAAVAGVIGALVVVYSTAYMREDEEEGYSLTWYYAVVLLFTGAMVGVALSDSLLALFIFWEVIGLCSFALIGYRHREPRARRAALQALVVTQLGGAGLLVAVVALWSEAGFTTMTQLLSTPLPAGLAPLVGGGFLLAAFAKSAQFPFHGWLPDAMEAPTTVSALIHAATLVNAGVYLAARAAPALAAWDGWGTSLLLVGSFTALITGIAALVERDLKRVLAHSTISQLGFMFAAVGASAVFAAQFHLLAQALFKAALFLAAGAVIQAVGTRDLGKMGGLGARMPVVRASFLLAVLAMAGVPPLIGFWSKDLALGAVLGSGNAVAGVLLVASAVLTAGYGARVYWLTFEGTRRGGVEVRATPPAMSSVVAALAVAAAGGAFFAGPMAASFAFTLPAAGPAPGFGEVLADVATPSALMVTAAALAVLVFSWGWWKERFAGEANRKSPIHRVVESSWGADTAYEAVAEAASGVAEFVRGVQTGDMNVNLTAVLVTLVAAVGAVFLLGGVV